MQKTAFTACITAMNAVFFEVLNQIVSRVLFRPSVTRKAAMIIHLGQQLPAASSDTTRERRAGHP